MDIINIRKSILKAISKGLQSKKKDRHQSAPKSYPSTAFSSLFEPRRNTLSTMDPALELELERTLLRREPAMRESLHSKIHRMENPRLAAFSISFSIRSLRSASLPAKIIISQSERMQEVFLRMFPAPPIPKLLFRSSGFVAVVSAMSALSTSVTSLRVSPTMVSSLILRSLFGCERFSEMVRSTPQPLERLYISSLISLYSYLY